MRNIKNDAVKLTWYFVRTVMFLFVGLRLTIFIEPSEQGTLENYLGIAMLVIVVIDSIGLIINFRQK